jgi:hypothetical protein
VDPVHEIMDLFPRLFFRKIIRKIWKIAGAMEILQNRLELLRNYIFVPVILHIGPYLTFYNYN